jgi:mRNA interferase MazF
MAITFHPYQGQILICNYDMKALGAEMVKPRPCIVISPRFRTRHGLSTIVPFSTTPPTKIETWHHLIKLVRPLPTPFSSPEM